MNLLNLGCGYRYHPDWTNVDFIETGDGVIAHNLLEGIPFESDKFNVVYHSHVLEHFSKSDGQKFIEECYRVLKPGGIIRIALPNLEGIICEYLRLLKGSLDGDPDAQENYNWIMLELYDQTVRNYSGGEMAKYLHKDVIKNKNYIYERVGEEAKTLWENWQKRKGNDSIEQKFSIRSRFYHKIKRILARTILFDESINSPKNIDAFRIGKFRLSGEIHQWMYDRYSISQLLYKVGFTSFKVTNAFDSSIPHWESYNLDSENQRVNKPDSLFVEAVKP